MLEDQILDKAYDVMYLLFNVEVVDGKIKNRDSSDSSIDESMD